MNKPNLENAMYNHLELTAALMRGIDNSLSTTIYANDDTRELLKGLLVGLAALQLEFDRSIEEFNAVSVCF